MTIGERIKEYRKMKGLSQSQLATSLNISRQAVNLWERNKAMPRISKLLRMKDIFGCNINDLLVNTDSVIMT